MPPADFIWQDTFWLIWNISQKKFSLLDSNEVSKPLMRNLLLPICQYSTSFSQRFLKTYLPAAIHRRPIFAKKSGNVSYDSIELNSDCLLGANIFLFHWSFIETFRAEIFHEPKQKFASYIHIHAIVFSCYSYSIFI